MITAGKGTILPSDLKCYKGVDLMIGKFCSIASGVKIVSGQHPPVEHPQCVTQYPFKEIWGADYYPSKMDGKVVIRNDCWIGEGVTIMEGVTIGNGAIIGACSVVVKNVPDYTLIAGNPGRIKRYRFTKQQIADLLQISWWDRKDEEIKEMIPAMKNVDSFIAKYKKIV